MEYLKALIQRLFHTFGFHIQQLEGDVSIKDAFAEQQRLLKNTTVKVIFDVGASDGRSGVHYHELFPHATIYTFEPFPESFEKLKKNAADKPYLVPLNYAVSDANGVAVFHNTQLDDASSLLSPTATDSSFDRHHVLKNTLEVKTITIEEVCKQYHIEQIDILKLDTQGAEVMALTGAEALLSKQKVALVYTECQFVRLYEGAAQFFEINTVLEKSGYSLFNIYNMVHNQKGQLSWGDAIFIPNNR